MINEFFLLESKDKDTILRDLQIGVFWGMGGGDALAKFIFNQLF